MIRITRLKAKISYIDYILACFVFTEGIDNLRHKITQLHLAKKGLQKIIHRCVCIYNNSEKYCNRSMFLPNGSTDFSFEFPSRDNYEYSYKYEYGPDVEGRSGYQYKHVYRPVEPKERIEGGKIDLRIPPNPIALQIYSDIQRLKQEGYKIDEL